MLTLTTGEMGLDLVISASLASMKTLELTNRTSTSLGLMSLCNCVKN